MYINLISRCNSSLMVLVCTIFLTACGGGGYSAPVVEDTPVVEETPAFAVTSENYTEGSAIPLLHACTALGGTDVSPQFSWTNPPTGTSSYAIIMDDETPPCGTGAEACVHWALFNLPSSTTALVSNVDISTIEGAVEGYTYDGATTDYAGPCPPSAHTYNTTVYALSSAMTTIGADPLFTSSTFEADYPGSILGQAEITGTFTP